MLTSLGWQLRAHHWSAVVEGTGVPHGTQADRLTSPPQRLP